MKKTESVELRHFGIKGMKWGIRRYQNEDGTYTPEGKKRQEEYSSDYVESREKKDIRSMSNDDLKKRINRYQLENQYRSLNPSVYNRGMSIAKKVIATAGVIGGLYAIKNAPFLKAGKEVIDSVSTQLDGIIAEKRGTSLW